MLDDALWTLREYKQRMTTKEWKEHLLRNGGTITYKGNIVKLAVKRLGFGVVEISIPAKR